MNVNRIIKRELNVWRKQLKLLLSFSIVGVTLFALLNCPTFYFRDIFTLVTVCHLPFADLTDVTLADGDTK